MNKEQLRQRWFTSEGAELLGRVRRVFAEGRAAAGVLEGLSVVEGRWDLRGAPALGRLAQVSGNAIAGFDFSTADLTGLRFNGCTIQNCVFDRTDCQDWRVWETNFSNCSFVGADLRGASLGAWGRGRGNVYDAVSFVRARFERANTSAAVYQDCDFSFARLDRLNFWQSSLVRCKFAGSLREVVFDGRMLGEGKATPNPMEDVDFLDVKFDGCDFRGVSLNSVRLPPDNDLVVFADLAAVDEFRRGMPSDPIHVDDVELLQEIFEGYEKMYIPGSSFLLNLRDIGSAASIVREMLATDGRHGVRLASE